MLKSYIFIILSTALFLGACQNKTENVATPVKAIAKPVVPSAMSAIKERGDTLIALTASYTASYFAYKGHTLGYEYELLQKLAEKLNVNLRIKPIDNIDSLFHYLNNGEGDLVAYSMTVTNQRRQNVDFTDRLYHSPQCLIQRKPVGWQNLLPHQISNRLIRNVLDIKQNPMYVRQESSYYERLHQLGDEIGDSLNIIPVSGVNSTFDLIEMVADGTIEYTIADQEIASMYSAYNNSIDYETTVSMPQKKAWAVRKNSPELLAAINQWLAKYKRYKEYYFIYDKYYNNPATLKKIRYYKYSSHKGNLSAYDDLIKEEVKAINWDWRLIAAQIYQESKFKNNLESWMGAKGLMQVLPATAEMHGFKNLDHPQTNIRTGITHLKYLENNFEDIDSLNRVKFTLAAYNVGTGHIYDAQRLAKYLGLNPSIWDNNVAEALLLKSKKEYYQLPECRNGYCRGSEPYKYVNEIMERYEHYKVLFN